MEERDVTEASRSGALDTLSAVAAEQTEEAEEHCNTLTKPMATPARDSTMLVPLVAGQKRSGLRSTEKALKPSSHGIQKVKGSPRNSGAQQQPNTPPGQPSTDSNQKLREQRRSAPDHGRRVSNELRGSKSAPDLSAHALAAIRSIQAGTLHLDSNLRTKIAAAAKRVLQARELKRRSSGGNLPLSSNQGDAAKAATDHASTIVSPVPAVIAPSNQDFPSPAQQPLPSMSPATNRLVAPQSLAAATAIARGESLLLSQSPPIPTHEPVSAQPSAGGFMAAHPPFTVTTGVPKFAQGKMSTPAALGPQSIPHSPQQSNISGSSLAKTSIPPQSIYELQMPARTEMQN